MIKQLQLRGISRTPSDRGAADGGCAESINVHLEQQETAPTMAPVDVSADIYGNSTRYPIIFIHKMTGKTNYIGQTTPSSNHYGFYAYGPDITNHHMGGTTPSPVMPVPSDETVTHVSAIGNTLIIFTDASPYYYLFKDGAYIYLGNEIPKPKIEVITQNATTGTNGASTWITRDVDIPDGTLKTARRAGGEPDYSRWNDAKIDGDECHSELLETMQNIWDAVAMQVAEQRGQGTFVAPFFIRYALRLYDDTYINSSTPIICGAHVSSDWMSAYLYDNHTDSDWGGYKMAVKLNNLFKVRLKGASMSGWGDIVKSIDIFASDPIYTPAVNAAFYSMAKRSSPEDGYLGCIITFQYMDSSSRAATIKNEVLSKGQFRKIKSIDLTNTSEMSSLTGGSMYINNADNISGDLWGVQDEMPSDYRDAIQYLPKSETMNYNKRLLLVGAKEMLSSGDVFLNGQAVTNGTTPLTVQMKFKIVNSVNGTVNYVLGRYYDGSTTYKTAFINSSSVQQHGDSTATVSKMCDSYCWFAYPDTRCTEVELQLQYGSGTSIHCVVPMEKHPLLECSYAYFGFGYNFFGNAASYYSTSGSLSTTEQRIMENANKLLLSEFENPFLFPAGNIVTFKDRLIGAATVSVPLSEGQYGEYPLYAFTEGGIRVLVTTAEGTIAAANAHPDLSRHVALDGTILGMEQAVIFITERGVMMLSGNQVTELSAAMIGPAYAVDTSISTLLTGSAWADLLNANDNLTINEFMAHAKIAYDSKNARLLFFYDDGTNRKPYHYEYYFTTQTWHKQYAPLGQNRILNSYPECLISYKDNGTAKVAKFSAMPTGTMYSTISGTGAVDVYGLIATRPFDLGEPDVRKSINDIRIRGRYNHADVQYVLLGSFDGINWQRLTSLRGGSYKQFRLVLLTKLTASERVTWIDIDYEPRMTNRLR